MEHDDTPEPTPWEQLIALWAERDARYAQRKTVLRPEEVAAIRLTRKVEVGLYLDPNDRGRGWARVHAWYPPEHGQ